MNKLPKAALRILVEAHHGGFLVGKNVAMSTEEAETVDFLLRKNLCEIHNPSSIFCTLKTTTFGKMVVAGLTEALAVTLKEHLRTPLFSSIVDDHGM